MLTTTPAMISVVPAGRVVGDDRLVPRREHEQQEPGRRHAEPRSVPDPRLARDHLGPQRRVLAKIARETSEHCGHVAAADLAGHAQRLEDAIGDGIREVRLQPIEAHGEVAGAAILGLERGECAARSRRAELGEGADALRQRHAGTHGGDEMVDDVGPDGAVRGTAAGCPCTHEDRHERHAEHRRDHREHGDREDRLCEGTRHDAEERADGDDHAERHARESGKGEFISHAPRHGRGARAVRACRPHQRRDHEQQAEAEECSEHETHAGPSPSTISGSRPAARNFSSRAGRAPVGTSAPPRTTKS